MQEDYGKLPVTEVITKRIQEMIRSGEFAPDTKLPSQRVLSEQLGVSRPSLREALLTLETLGLIRTLPARGTFVVGEKDKKAPMSWRFDASYSLLEVFQTRLVVEVEICRLAALEINAEQLTRLSAAAAQFEESWHDGDLVSHVAADLAFHAEITEACPNGMLRAFYQSIHEMLTESQRAPIPRTEVDRMEASIAEHRSILAALKARDAARSADAMRQHILNTANIAGLRV